MFGKVRGRLKEGGVILLREILIGASDGPLKRRLACSSLLDVKVLLSSRQGATLP
jgi:hypothetical protein